MELKDIDSAREALAFFDRLEPVPLPAMRGNWAGAELPTGHPLDGALQAYGWHGKRVDSDEDVHPLVFDTWAGRVHVNPALLAPLVPRLLRNAWLKSPAVAACGRALLPVLATRRSRARLRLLQFRGQLSAAIVYDDAPIQDIFRRIDDRTLLGLMDMKGVEQPFFFLLRRESE